MRTLLQAAEIGQNIKHDNSIVAVPGLGASPEWTWKSKNKVDWLRDVNMLSRSVPNARIMVFEYESQWFGKGSIDQKLSSVADQLVLALFHTRSVCSQKRNLQPIMQLYMGIPNLNTIREGQRGQSCLYATV